MSCVCSKQTDEFHGWECSITDGACMFLFPSSKKCAEVYGEGPDANHDKCEDCIKFYTEENKRCCTTEPLRMSEDYKESISSKYIEDDTVCCGGFKRKISKETE